MSASIFMSIARIFPDEFMAVLYEISSGKAEFMNFLCSSCEKQSFTGLPVFNAASAVCAHIIEFRHNPFFE